MSSKAFQYYAFLIEFNEELNQAKMLLLPAKAKASRVKPIEKSKIQFKIKNFLLLTLFRSESCFPPAARAEYLYPVRPARL